jgi:hypothetical protein
MKGQKSLHYSTKDYHFIEQAKGIKYSYASLDKHPDESGDPVGKNKGAKPPKIARQLALTRVIC